MHGPRPQEQRKECRVSEARRYRQPISGSHYVGSKLAKELQVHTVDWSSESIITVRRHTCWTCNPDDIGDSLASTS
jgi:hypothetical protein